LQFITIPKDLDLVLDEAWSVARKVPGFLLEKEARLLGMIAACNPGDGEIIEIGSFKGKSTVMLAKVRQHYGLGPVVAIDPHNFNSVELRQHKTSEDASSYTEFLDNIRLAGVSDHVQPIRAYSSDVALNWNRPIRFLWIDGDHTYSGAKKDFDGFFPYVMPGGLVAFHDALHEFPGPIRVFAEDVLRSNEFGPAGFVGSIAWSQFRPADGANFRDEREGLLRFAEPLIPFVQDDAKLRGLRKIRFKLKRSKVPRTSILPEQWAALLNR